MTQVVIQEQQRGLVKPGLIPSVSLALAGQGAALSPSLSNPMLKSRNRQKTSKALRFFAFDNPNV